jgi:methylmalonyl-CoA mutase cobalamin-binding subunit
VHDVLVRRVASHVVKRRVLLSSVSSDSHTWNFVFLQLLLEESGCEVINLGPCVPDEILVERARRERPDIVVISSVNGHGRLDGARMIRRLRADPGTRDIPAVIGGKVGVRHDDAQGKELLDAGFDAVFMDTEDPRLLTTYLARLPERAAAGVTP